MDLDVKHDRTNPFPKHEKVVDQALVEAENWFLSLSHRVSDFNLDYPDLSGGYIQATEIQVQVLNEELGTKLKTGDVFGLPNSSKVIGFEQDGDTARLWFGVGEPQDYLEPAEKIWYSPWHSWVNVPKTVPHGDPTESRTAGLLGSCPKPPNYTQCPSPAQWLALAAVMVILLSFFFLVVRG